MVLASRTVCKVFDNMAIISQVAAGCDKDVYKGESRPNEVFPVGMRESLFTEFQTPNEMTHGAAHQACL